LTNNDKVPLCLFSKSLESIEIRSIAAKKFCEIRTGELVYCIQREREREREGGESE